MAGGAGRLQTHGYDGSEQAVQAVRLALPRREPYFCRRQTSRKPKTAWHASREPGGLGLVPEK